VSLLDQLPAIGDGGWRMATTAVVVDEEEEEKKEKEEKNGLILKFVLGNKNQLFFLILFQIYFREQKIKICSQKQKFYQTRFCFKTIPRNKKS